MNHPSRKTIEDPKGSYFLYDTKEAANADCAKFNQTVPVFHATVEDAHDHTDKFVVNVWRGATGANFAATYGPTWRKAAAAAAA